MGYQKQLCSAGLFLLLSAVLICAVLQISDTHAAVASASDAENASVSEPAAVLTLSNIQPYVLPAVKTEEVPASDLAETIVSHICGSGQTVVFYRSQSGDIYGAYLRGADTLVRFTQEYCVRDAYGNPWGYQYGYEIHPYEDVFGHDGFRIVCGRGAAYLADDYYYFDEKGTLHLLAQCSNTVYETDVNGDGEKELLYFPGGLPPAAYYDYERGGMRYEANLNDLVAAAEPDWQMIGAGYDGSALEMSYSLAGDSVRHFARLSVAEAAVSVYETVEIQLPGLPACSGAEIAGDGAAPVKLIASDEDTMQALCELYSGLRLTPTTKQMNGEKCWRITFHIPEQTGDAAVPAGDLIWTIDAGGVCTFTGFPGTYIAVKGWSQEAVERLFSGRATSYSASEGEEVRQVLRQYYGRHFNPASSSAVFTDLTQDGLPELLVLDMRDANKDPQPIHSGAVSENSFYDARVYVYFAADSETVTELYSDRVTSAETLWKRLYLYRKEGKEYLLDYEPEMIDGYSRFQYEVFALTPPGGAHQTLISGEVDFPGPGAGNSVAGASPEQIRAFQAEVGGLLKDAVPIVGYGAVTDPFSGMKGPIYFAYLDETLR